MPPDTEPPFLPGSFAIREVTRWKGRFLEWTAENAANLRRLYLERILDYGYFLEDSGISDSRLKRYFYGISCLEARHLKGLARALKMGQDELEMALLFKGNTKK